MVNIDIYNNGNLLCSFYDVKLEKFDSNTREMIINGDKKIFISLGRNDTVIVEERPSETDEDVPF
jgi:hypothetical protein